MSRTLTAQTLGSVLVTGSLVLSEVAVRLLDACPRSATLWYVNLAVFAPLRQVRADPSPFAAFLRQAALTEVSLLLLLAVAVQAARFRLGVAVLSHLSFGVSVMVARAWVADPHGSVALGLLVRRELGGTCLVVLLLAVSGLACALCHLSFLLDIVRPSNDRIGRRAVPSPVRPGAGSGAWRGFSERIGETFAALRCLRRSHANFIGHFGADGRGGARPAGGEGSA